MMSPKMHKAFRYLGYLEALSFLLLLGIAMPLKYFAGMPIAVRITGSIHGILFILYLISAFSYGDKHNWRGKDYFVAFVAAVIPLGPIFFERRILRQGTHWISRRSSASESRIETQLVLPRIFPSIRGLGLGQWPVFSVAHDRDNSGLSL